MSVDKAAADSFGGQVDEEEVGEGVYYFCAVLRDDVVLCTLDFILRKGFCELTSSHQSKVEVTGDPKVVGMKSVNVSRTCNPYIGVY